MSQTVNERKLRCHFGILNLSGLMDMRDHLDENEIGHSQVICPVFSTESYTIKTTFNRNLFFKNPQQTKYETSAHFGMMQFFDKDKNREYQGKYYQKKFRRQVMWDFGDGTKITGYSAEHHYKKPGRYKVTCTFFDINRRTWTNDYCIYVIVKQLIPTVIRFDEQIYPSTIIKDRIRCSKIERIARIEALNSNTVQQELKISAQRIFTEEEHNQEYEEIYRHFNNLPDTTFKFMQKYWTFLQNSQTLFYNSDRVHSNYLVPSNLFTPKYTDIYAKIYYQPQTVGEDGEVIKGRIAVSFYQVIPYKHIDTNLKSIKILDPNSSILDYKHEEYVDIPITQVYTMQQLPQDVAYVGRRGYCDIFYKNDFIGNPNVLRFVYDLEQNITGELVNSTSYLNIPPLGVTISVISNDIDNVKIGLSSDGFLREGQGTTWNNSRNNYYIDEHLYNSLYKGIDIDVYIFPFIEYQEQFYIQGADDLVVDIHEGGYMAEKMYYVPKDLQLSLKSTPILLKNMGNSSYVNHGLPDDFDDYEAWEEKQMDYIIGINPWFYRVPLVLQDYINLRFEISCSKINAPSNEIFIDVPFKKDQKLKSSDDIVIPRHKQSYQNVDQLLSVYMNHPMFDEADNLKDAMRAFLDGGWLQDVLTATDNFIDDTANIRTCYLSNLVSMLKMMGEDVTQFEKSAFDGVNDLKNFVRILSMNHSDLVGHVIKQNYDINVARDSRGKHVGDEIEVEDVLFLNQHQGENLGKITSIKRKNSDKILSISIENGVDLIVVDRYTNVSKIVKFYQMQINSKNNNQQYVQSLTLGDYDQSWGWNLLLPYSFDSINARIAKNQEKINDGRYSQAQRERFRKENEVFKKNKKDLVKGYYRFFLLNDRRSDNRIGNFIENAYISNKVQDVEQWNKLWGITHDIMMKIIIDNCFLKNGRKISGVYEDGEIVPPPAPEYVTTGEIDTTLVLGEEIPYLLKVNGQVNHHMLFDGNVVIRGYIEGVGKNEIIISMPPCTIDNYYQLALPPTSLQVRVNHDGSLVENTQTYNLSANNANGKMTVITSGTVENPNFSVSLNVDLFDFRMEDKVVFGSGHVFTNTRAYYLTNLKRQELGSMQVLAGYMENKNNKELEVSLTFNNESRLGDNDCKVTIRYNMGRNRYIRPDGTITTSNNNVVLLENYHVVVNIDDYGQIRFPNDTIIIPFEKTTDGNIAKGRFYLNLKGNCILNTHKLTCWSYDPLLDEKSDLGTKTIMAEVGGYSLLINKNISGQEFTVNDSDGISQGYYCKLVSTGTVVGGNKINFSCSSNITLNIYNSSDEIVYSKSFVHNNIADVDENGFIDERQVMYKFDDTLKGSIAVNTFGGFYDITGYDLQLSLK